MQVHSSNHPDQISSLGAFRSFVRHLFGYKKHTRPSVPSPPSFVPRPLSSSFHPCFQEEKKKTSLVVHHNVSTHSVRRALSTSSSARLRALLLAAHSLTLISLTFAQRRNAVGPLWSSCSFFWLSYFLTLARELDSTTFPHCIPFIVLPAALPAPLDCRHHGLQLE
jgi:hypothetical protein